MYEVGLVFKILHDFQASQSTTMIHQITYQNGLLVKGRCKNLIQNAMPLRFYITPHKLCHCCLHSPASASLPFLSDPLFLAGQWINIQWCKKNPKQIELFTFILVSTWAALLCAFEHSSIRDSWNGIQYCLTSATAQQNNGTTNVLPHLAPINVQNCGGLF